MGSTKADIAVSYDVSNEFFRLWLDERMNYTCGIFDDSDRRMDLDVPGPISLEEAQLRKLRILSDFAQITRESTVLDIGCGWGANLEYQSM